MLKVSSVLQTSPGSRSGELFIYMLINRYYYYFFFLNRGCTSAKKLITITLCNIAISIVVILCKCFNCKKKDMMLITTVL